MDEELDKIFLPLAEAESGEWGNGLTGKLAFTDAPLTAKTIVKIRQLIKQARNNEIEALVTHIQDKFEEVEVLLNEYQYVRTRAIDAEDETKEGKDNG